MLCVLRIHRKIEITVRAGNNVFILCLIKYIEQVKIYIQCDISWPLSNQMCNILQIDPILLIQEKGVFWLAVFLALKGPKIFYWHQGKAPLTSKLQVQPSTCMWEAQTDNTNLCSQVLGVLPKLQDKTFWVRTHVTSCYVSESSAFHSPWRLALQEGTKSSPVFRLGWRDGWNWMIQYTSRKACILWYVHG